jgi:hypothetical protein
VSSAVVWLLCYGKQAGSLSSCSLKRCLTIWCRAVGLPSRAASVVLPAFHTGQTLQRQRDSLKGKD